MSQSSVSQSRASACSPFAFEQRYREHEDPWRFASSDYELNRYDTTVRNLRRARYSRAFEPGCSVGILTSRLAERCEEVVATEVAPSALARARARCAPFPNVRFELQDLGESMPEGRFDLVVLSEIGYYFDRDRLRAIATGLSASLESGGELIAVHWLGHSDDHVLHGDDVHAVLRDSLPLQQTSSARYAHFRLDSWMRV